jgi:hypothetical protein
VSDGSCTVGDLRTIDVPTTVEGVIISRLDRLAPGEQLCLKVASVIGRLFRERMVRETHPVEDERPRSTAVSRRSPPAHLTMLETPEPDLAYLFKHVITRDVTYESMPIAQRQPLHRAVATWYERNHAKDLSPHYALLAYQLGARRRPGAHGGLPRESRTAGHVRRRVSRRGDIPDAGDGACRRRSGRRACLAARAVGKRSRPFAILLRRAEREPRSL